MKRLKILILSDYAFDKGGAERVAISSAVGLSKRGHEVVFFSAVGPIDGNLSKARLKSVICLNQKDILDNSNKLMAGLYGIYNWKAIKELKKLFSYWIPDIAHIHGVSKALSWSPVNLIYSYKVPIIYTLHDYGLLCPNLGIYNFKTEKVCEYYKPGYKFRCFTANCDKRNYAQKLWRWVRFFIVRNIFKIDRKVSGYIAVSKFIGKLAREYLAGDKSVRVIYNPIEMDENILIKREENRRRGIKFLYVGRLSLEKGIDLLLNVMSKIDAILTIIGDGELMNICKDSAEKLRKGKIRILGHQNKKRVFDEMRKSNALVLPSRCMEPAPLVLAEAAYKGLPSIVANHGGLVEFIKDGVNGLHFKAGSNESLRESMECIMKNPLLSKKLGIKARRLIVEKDLSIYKHLKKIEEYYADILRI